MQESAENVIRHHLTGRSKLFTPLRVQGAPPGKALTPARVTEGVFLNSGTPFRIVDTWTSRSDAHRDLGARWTGSTRFLRRSPQAFNVMSECGGQLARLSHVRSEKGCEDIHSLPPTLVAARHPCCGFGCKCWMWTSLLSPCMLGAVQPCCGFGCKCWLGRHD